MRSTTLGAALLAAVAVGSSTRTTAHAASQELKWGPAPAVFPAGAQMAVLQGDPSKAEPFTVRLRMPDGYRIAAHTHPTDEHVTVIQGTFLVGMGDRFNADSLQALPTGSFVTAPARHGHFAAARGVTVVQVQAEGPFALTYLNPSDLPIAARGTR